MAKYEKRLTGNFDEFLARLHDDITQRSASATYEDGTDIALGHTRVAVRVYERYSMTGGNRVSLNITLAGDGDSLFLSAITSGGSRAVLFKINTIGEEAFLVEVVRSAEEYAAGRI
jgi:hypothetical protein